LPCKNPCGSLLAFNLYWSMMDFLNLFLKSILYLDPGSGSVLIQIIIATILGGLIAIRVFWSRLIARFRGGARQAEQEASPDPNDEEPQ
jgi:hypothetical protein